MNVSIEYISILWKDEDLGKEVICVPWGWGVVTDERVKLGEIIKKSFPTHKTSSSGLNLL